MSRRLKNRPRIAPGTRSPIHAVHALLPTTPRMLATVTTMTNVASAATSESPRNGTASIGSHTSREVPMEATASGLAPRRCVSQAAGSCSTCAATGSAVSRPMVTALAPR
jgi:hypothetical protein